MIIHFHPPISNFFSVDISTSSFKKHVLIDEKEVWRIEAVEIRVEHSAATAQHKEYRKACGGQVFKGKIA